MVLTDEDALVCDFAETYGVFDFRSLPLLTAAALAQGLNADSRIMRKLNGTGHSFETMLLAMIADRVGHLIWMLSEDGRKGRNRPKYILDELLNWSEQKETVGFDSGDEFMAAWRQLTEEAEYGD